MPLQDGKVITGTVSGIYMRLHHNLAFHQNWRISGRRRMGNWRANHLYTHWIQQPEPAPWIWVLYLPWVESPQGDPEVVEGTSTPIRKKGNSEAVEGTSTPIRPRKR